MAASDFVPLIAPGGLAAVLLLGARSIYNGTWVPRPTHDAVVTRLTDELERWKASSEKWEQVAEGRLKLVQQRQEAVVEVTTHVVEGIRKAGAANVVQEKD